MIEPLPAVCANTDTASVSYEGIWESGREYRRGQFITFQGSLWHCQADLTTKRPGGGAREWKLAVKRGAEGKAAKNGTEK